jgi:hypothetical protein
MSTTTANLASNAASTLVDGGNSPSITPDLSLVQTTDAAELAVDN